MVHKLTRRQFVSGSAAAGAVLLGAPMIVRAAAGEWGDLVGRFEFDGAAPERKKLKVDTDVECCGRHDIRDESLMVGDDRGLANVYVYVRTRGVEISPELEEAAEPQVLLDNSDCIFIPHCLKIWCTKQELYTINTQPIADNVAFSPLGDVPANIILPKCDDPDQPTSATWTFRRPQSVPVPISCNYHKWESGYILPRENPYTAISAGDGTFRIPKLPAGELEFQVWHERIGYLDTPAWPKGRFVHTIKPGTNDLGTVKLTPSLFEK